MCYSSSVADFCLIFGIFLILMQFLTGPSFIHFDYQRLPKKFLTLNQGHFNPIEKSNRVFI